MSHDEYDDETHEALTEIVRTADQLRSQIDARITENSEDRIQAIRALTGTKTDALSTVTKALDAADAGLQDTRRVLTDVASLAREALSRR